MEAAGRPAERRGPARRRPRWVLGLVPLLLIVAAVGAVRALGGPGLGERTGPPVEELAVERTMLEPGAIELTVRNDGPDAVRVAQVIVNDAFAAFTGAERADRAPGSRDACDPAAVDRGRGLRGRAADLDRRRRSRTRSRSPSRRPTATLGFFGLMALLGIYVGVIPIALGMLWLPWIRRIPPAWLRVVMALTVGLLAFLAIDATLEGLELAARGLAGVRRRGARLPRRGRRLPRADRRRRVAAAPPRAAAARRERPHARVLIAVGIGLHNLGEGLAIGTAYTTGALALGAFLVVGFALHNTTEGLAIVAPIAARRPSLRRLALLGLIAGAPAVLGAWIGAVGVQHRRRRVPVRRRRRRDRPGHRAARADAARRATGARCTRASSAACSPAWRSCSRPGCS